MEQIRTKVVDRLDALNKIKFYNHTRFELTGIRPLMDRVYRQEQRVYNKKVEKQKQEYLQKLKKVEGYLSELEVENKRRATLLDAYEKDLDFVERPVFQPIGLVVPRPVIGFNNIPMMKMPRSHSRRRLNSTRRVR